MSAIAVLTVVLATLAGSQQGQGCNGKWSSAVSLVVPDGRPVYVEYPSAASQGRQLALFGTPSFVWAETDQFDVPPSPTSADTAKYFERLKLNHGFAGFLLNPTQPVRPLRPPEGVVMSRASAAAGKAGPVHVVWLAKGAGSDRENEVWHAELRDERWGVPTRIFAASAIDPWGTRPSISVHGDEVHVVVAYRNPSRAGVAYIRRIGNRWRTTEAAVGPLASQAVALPVGDSLLIAYTALLAHAPNGPTGRHLFVIKVTDSVWSKPQLVHNVGLDAVRWARMYAVHSDRRARKVVMLWSRVRQSQSGSNGIYAAVSTDRGSTWQFLPTLEFPFVIGRFTSLQDSRERLHVVVTPLTQNKEAMYHAVLAGDKWTAPQQLGIGRAASNPALAISGDNVLLFWGEARPSQANNAGPPAPISKYSVFQESCS